MRNRKQHIIVHMDQAHIVKLMDELSAEGWEFVAWVEKPKARHPSRGRRALLRRDWILKFDE